MIWARPGEASAGLDIRDTEESPICDLRFAIEKNMERSNAIRQSALFLAVSVWVFLLLSLGSFHPTDWPSHQVYPYPAIQNACGSAGAWVAYHCFVGFG